MPGSALAPGVITRCLSVAPTNAHELYVLPELLTQHTTSGLLVGDCNYHSPMTAEELATMGVELLAYTPPRGAIRIPKGACC